MKKFTFDANVHMQIAEKSNKDQREFSACDLRLGEHFKVHFLSSNSGCINKI